MTRTYAAGTCNIRAGAAGDTLDAQVRAQSPGAAGFTLLEVLAVLFILALMTALVFPSFTGSSTSRVKAEAGRMASILRNLDDTSAAAKVTLSVEFDFKVTADNSKDNSVLWTEPSGNSDSPTVSHKAEFRSLRGVELPSHGLVKEGQLTVFFDPSLMPDPIRVYFEEGRSKAVVYYNPISRRTKVDVLQE